MFANRVFDVVVPDTVDLGFELAAGVNQKSWHHGQLQVLLQFFWEELLVALPKAQSHLWVIVIVPQSGVVRYDGLARAAPVEMAVN